MEIKTIYEDEDVLVVDKPAGVIVFQEESNGSNEERLFASRQKAVITLIDELIKKYPKLAEVGLPPRYGIVHRLDKDTSGVLLVAKSEEALIFLQKQFKNRTVEKKYIALVEGVIKEDNGVIETLIARAPKDKRKQRAYATGEPAPSGARQAVTEYKVLERFEDYTLLEAQIKTGRRHQIRCHLSYILHPIAGDKMYSFKNSTNPAGLERQFLHSAYLKIQLPGGQVKEFKSDLPEDLKNVLQSLKPTTHE